MKGEEMARILVIDDVDVIRGYLRQTLEAAGHEVVEASSGREGIHEVEQAAFDAVLTDLHMPDQGGLATITAIHSLRPGTPVLVMTGDLPPDWSRLKLEAFLGTVATLKKPFEETALFEALHTALGAPTAR